ncbi:hypothetical protein [Devosia sp. 1566]|uniref:hypothetical protein n=1 Tax=Devosia sp. 1566 TaxID=2499144 RepID=UPI000FD961D5|nr:hypothetical protein [Devosia sp. 1566]
MSLKISLVALALLATAPVTMAAESLVETREINGRTINEITSVLAHRDIDATSVEQWGDAIRVQAVNPDGSHYVVLVDRYTLSPLGSTNAVGTNLDVGASAPAARTSSTFAPASLSLNTDD